MYFSPTIFLGMKGSTYDYALPVPLLTTPFPLTEFMLMIVGGSCVYAVMLMVVFCSLRRVVKVDLREKALSEADEELELHYMPELTRPDNDAALPIYEGEREGPTQVSIEPTRNVQAKKNKTVEYI
ncbi:hypothetical protein BC829DRAFT_415606 [Chytridium lagenaria]|nr:hypothetical protein BC829DRAFT_415606 [Chytridium lagenaria]